ncbi:MAG: HD domain-containing protein [Dorea sp.]
MDLQYAKEQFEKYLNHYNREDPKVKLKIIHTYGVVECSRQIAQRMHLSEEDIELAQLIGLLHDIGRFEQLKRFNSFEPDTMDHALFGVQILFDEGMIRTFVEDDRCDSVIREAIGEHSSFQIKDGLNERELLHAKIIRDADKLDNCRVKLEDAIETILGVSEEEVGKTRISPEVMAQFDNRRSILSSTRKTKMDYWMSYIAYFFDINFKESLEIIQEQEYVEKLIARIPYTDPETEKEMQKVKKALTEYITSAIIK